MASLVPFAQKKPTTILPSLNIPNSSSQPSPLNIAPRIPVATAQPQQRLTVAPLQQSAAISLPKYTGPAAPQSAEYNQRIADMFNNSALGQGFNIVKGIGQGFAQAVPTIGNSVAALANGIATGKWQDVQTRIDNPIAQTLIGTNKIGTIQDYGNDTLSSVGIKNANPVVQNLVGGLLTAANLTPVAGKPIKEGLTAVEDVAKVAKAAQRDVPAVKALSLSEKPSITKGVPKVPAISLQAKQVPSKTVEVLPQRTDITLRPNTSTQDYIKSMTKAQNAARKANSMSLPNKVKSEVKTKLIDSLAPIEDTLNKNLKQNGVTLPTSLHITPQLDRALRARSIAGQYVKDNGLDKVIQNVRDTKAFDQYLIAKQTRDIRKNGIETGRNKAKDTQLIKDLAPTYERHAQAIKKYNNDLLDLTVNYGLTSKESAVALKKRYPSYVPTNKIFSDEEIPKPHSGGGKASISTQSVIKTLKGSKRQVESPLASILSKTNDVISEGERNRAAQLLASYKDLPGNPFNLRELGKDENIGAKAVVSHFDNGKVRRFETTPEIAAAAKSLNKEQVGIIGSILRVPTRLLRLGATGVNAGFALANVAKDQVSALINSEHAISGLAPGVQKQALASAFNHNSKSYRELVREGAGGTSFDIARNEPLQSVARIRSQKNLGTTIAYTVTHPAELLRAVENTIGRSEEFTRAQQYFGNKNAALSEGMSAVDARAYGANAARNNTVNFARAGDYGAVLNSALPYLNAGIQGSRTLLRSIKNRPVETAAKIAILSTLPAATTTAWNLSDPKRKAAYDSISDYEKEGNMIIVPSDPQFNEKTGRWNVIKIPVSQEIANLNNIVRNGVETVAGENTTSAASILGNLIGTTTSLNAQTPRQVVGQFTPQALKPGIEGITNQNLFTGTQIVPDFQKNLPASQQSNQYTSGTAKTIGNLTGTSPEVIDNTIRTATGGAGQNAVNASDTALSALGIIKPGDVKGQGILDSVLNRFDSATSKSPTTLASDTYQKARQQLLDTPEYKALTQDDQAKALNRLETDIKAIQYNKTDTANPSGGYTATPLTKNQAAYVAGTKNIASYATPTATTPASTVPKTPQEKYTAAVDAYNKAKAAGTLSPAKDFATQASLSKQAVTSKYPQAVLDFYNLSKAQQNAYFASDRKTATSLYDQAKNLDSELVSKGLSTTKYKTPVTGTKTTKAKKVSVASMNKYTKVTKVKAPIIKVTRAKIPKVAKFKTPKLKKTTIKGVA